MRPLEGLSLWNSNSGGRRGSSPGGPGGPGVPTGPRSPLGPVISFNQFEYAVSKNKKGEWEMRRTSLPFGAFRSGWSFQSWQSLRTIASFLTHGTNRTLKRNQRHHQAGTRVVHKETPGSNKIPVLLWVQLDLRVHSIQLLLSLLLHLYDQQLPVLLDDL